jgi:DNA-binding FadR family transcriptional regulator
LRGARAARIGEDEVAEIRAFLDAEAAQVAAGETASLHDFHVLVARLTANPALHLFVQTLTDLTQQPAALERNRASADHLHAAHVKIAEAIIARDEALARHRMMTHLEETSAAGHRRPAARSDPARTTAPSAMG